MPIRTAKLTHKISANGQALHRAMMRREASGPGAEPSEAESALLEERRRLKEERDKRNQEGPKRRPRALDRLVRTHHPEAQGAQDPVREACRKGCRAGSRAPRTEEAGDEVTRRGPAPRLRSIKARGLHLTHLAAATGCAP
jgi:hypothetical protein